MDKFALNEKRRETVTSLLKGMDIKTSDGGGLDKADVLDCLQQVCNLYESHIDELEKHYEAEIGELTKRYQKYDENNDLYVSLIMDAKKSSKEIIDQATQEVDGILSNGREKIELQERALQQLKEDSEREKESLAAELRASKDYAEAEKAAMRLEIEAEREKLEATKNKYRQQIIAMEGEFTEIRTNILRTSARLDALKAQSEDETAEIEWDVQQAVDEVQVPDADIEVDQVLEIEPEPVAEPAVEEVEEPIEPLASDESFEEAFFKSDILNSFPKVEEPVVEEVAAPVEEPVFEPAPEPVAEEPVEEAAKEISVEELLASMDALTAFEPAEEPVAFEEPVAEEIVAAEPVEPAAEHVGEPTEDIEALLNEISFDDVLEEEPTEVIEDGLDEISLDELVGLEDVVAEPVAEVAEPAPEAVEPVVEMTEPVTEAIEEAVEAPVEAAPAVAEEISFEKLEALFKEEL
ncbi:MAG: hypothetical protein Q4D99_05670 [Bacillota bacterium]|nr:hypothetical protein [Bacillota bacterium]